MNAPAIDSVGRIGNRFQLPSCEGNAFGAVGQQEKQLISKANGRGERDTDWTQTQTVAVSAFDEWARARD